MSTMPFMCLVNNLLSHSEIYNHRRMKREQIDIFLLISWGGQKEDEPLCFSFLKSAFLLCKLLPYRVLDVNCEWLNNFRNEQLNSGYPSFCPPQIKISTLIILECIME